MKLFKYKYLLLIFTLISCNKAEQSKQLSQFTFDEAIHYSTGKKDSIYSNINRKRYKNLTSVEKLYLDFVGGNIPTKLTDKSFISNLEKLKFKKRIINNSKINDLRKIFSHEFCNELQDNGCTPMYRDIYIFKKNNQITGIAKVCFRCEIVDFVSYNYRWKRYGECDSYKSLKKI